MTQPSLKYTINDTVTTEFSYYEVEKVFSEYTSNIPDSFKEKIKTKSCEEKILKKTIKLEKNQKTCFHGSKNHVQYTEPPASSFKIFE